MSTAAADLIRALEAGGMTQREIARRISRGPSYVSKVATGRKPGGGLEASLRALQRGAGSAHAPRRRTAAGTVARVRTSTRAPEPRRSPLSLAERVREGMRPDGMGGSFSSGATGRPVSWNVRAWRGSGGWQDLRSGADGFSNPGSVEYVVLELPNPDGGKPLLRQFAVFLTDEYDFADFIADVLSEYGVAE